LQLKKILIIKNYQKYLIIDVQISI